MTFKARKKVWTFNYSSVKLRKSMFQEQFYKMKEFYLNIPNDSILKGFRERAGLPSPGVSLGGWYDANMPLSMMFKKRPTTLCHTFGQWLSAFARMYKVTKDYNILDKVTYLLDEWGKTIESDGFFFYGKNPATMHYDYDKTIGGLADIYEYVGEERAIKYAERITFWAIKNLNRRRIPATPDCPGGGGWTGGENSDVEWYTLAENLYRLYTLTSKSLYLDFAKIWHYESYWSELAKGNPHCMTGLHAYSHVNTLSSAAMAYAVTGDILFLNAIKGAYKIIQESQVYATGGYGPGEKMANQCGSLGDSLYLEEDTFETICGTWAAFKIASYLMMFTGESIYGDWIEKLFYNGIGSALPMGNGGKTFYYSNYKTSGGEKQYFIDKRFPLDPSLSWTPWPCCSGTYPLVVTEYHNIIYFQDEESIYVNLFVPSEVVWKIAGENVTLIQETNFPESGNISFKIIISNPIDFSFKFRVPAWAKNNVLVKINDEIFDGEWRSGNWGVIKRTWNNNDNLNIEFPINLSFISVDKYHPNLAALAYGPIVLVANKGGGILHGDIETPSSWILPMSENPLLFQTKDKRDNIEFKPFFKVGEREQYYIYHEIKK